MSALIENAAACEIRSVIRFLNAKKVKPSEIYRQIREVYGQNAMSDSMVRRWVRQFNEGRNQVHDEERCGRPSLVTDELVQAIEEKVKQNLFGIMWNTVKDHLFVGIQSLVDSLSNNENIKRHRLRAVGKIFDPLGLLTSFTIHVKCILKVLWLKKISWDAELPPDIRRICCQWVSEVPRLSEIEIPTYVLHSSVEEPSDVLKLHCFCDSSQKAYGVAIYTRVVKDWNVEVNLLVSKGRVAPLTKITLPRLELLDDCLMTDLPSLEEDSNGASIDLCRQHWLLSSL
ncbi:unnamed protein product [Larinioides sclopetarius]|uniref:Mos1 transposase HTH domain-containing protein n=1 Tax=Larinioides sclopetarius TaxID=280406 RepID=A0AAV2ABF4_9ARAC